MDETVKKYTTRKEFFKQYKKKSRLQETWNRFLRNKLAVMGLFIFVLIMLAAVVAPLIANYETDAIKINVPNRLSHLTPSIFSVLMNWGGILWPV
jgi:peptide/nickel transport system permease protein